MIDYTSIPPLNAAALLKKHGIRADKRLGQIFLQDPLALEKIARTAEITPEDTILEIGPGLGSLTRYLASAGRKVVAVELDARLIPILAAVLAPYANIELIQADILKIALSGVIQQPGYIVAANIPYYITSAVIRHLLEGDPKPRQVVLTIQKEVAQRICALPGDMSLLALSVQVYGKPVIAASIPAEAFFPSPKVESAVVRIDIYPGPLIQEKLLEKFFRLIKAGFSQKRKKLRNSISAGLRISPLDAEVLLHKANIEPQRRAESLSISEWEGLASEL